MRYNISNGNAYNKTDYEVYLSYDDEWTKKEVESYISNNNITNKKFADDYGLNYNDLLKYLNKKTSSFSYIGRRLSRIVHEIKSKMEIDENYNKKGIKLSNFDIDVVNLLCSFVLDNDNNKVVIGNSSFVDDFDRVVEYINENGVRLKITDVFHGRGDHDPNITFSFLDFSRDKIESIINKIQY